MPRSLRRLAKPIEPTSDMTAYITPRDGIPRRYELTATDATAAHAEARRIGAAFGSFTYLVRTA